MMLNCSGCAPVAPAVTTSFAKAMEVKKALAGKQWISPALLCSRGEMDITADFGSAVGGSNPSGSTKVLGQTTKSAAKVLRSFSERAFESGRGYQSNLTIFWAYALIIYMNEVSQGDQGKLFDDALRGTDPKNLRLKIEEHPGGYYPADHKPQIPEDAEFAAKVHEAVLEDQSGPDEIKQLSQKGKHNPFSRAKKHGSTKYHEFVKMGDAVSGFSGIHIKDFIKSEEQLEEARKFLKDKYERQLETGNSIDGDRHSKGDA